VSLEVLREDDAGGGVCWLQHSRVAALKARGRSRGQQVDCDDDGARAFASAVAAPTTYWASKGGGPSSSGSTRSVGGVNVSAGPKWSFKDETASIVSVHPCIDQQKAVYLAHRNGKLRKFSADGALLWTNTANFDIKKRQAAQFVTGGPVLLGGAVFIGSVDGHITAVDAASGRMLWRERVAASCGPDSWSLAGVGGTVFAAMRSADLHPEPDFGGADQIIAVDASSGRVVWTFQLPAEDMIVYNWLGSFADDPPSLLFSTVLGRPYRLRLCDGTVVWQGPAISNATNTPMPTTGGMALGPSGLAYVPRNVAVDGGKQRGLLSAYNISTGAIVWTRPLALPTSNAPAIGRLSGASGSMSVVVAVGENAWFPDPIAELRGTFADGTPVAYNSEILALDAATGEPTGWRYAPPPHRRPQAEGDAYPDHICLPDAWSNAAIGGDGTVYIGHMSGNIFALRDADGDGALDADAGEVQSYYGGRCYQGSPGVAPGMVVSTPCDGMHVFLADGGSSAAA